MIDACAFHEWTSVSALYPYLPDGYREILAPSTVIASPRRLADPRGAKAADALPENGVAGSDFDLFRQQLLDDGRRERVVLSYDDGLLSAMLSAHYFARDLARAANDWTVEEWLARDDRLHGLVLVAGAIPADGAAEIRRIGQHERMVGVALVPSPAGLGLGHPIYHPIYEAAAELGLPIVIQDSPTVAADMKAPIVVGAHPTTFAEWKALSWHSQAAQVTSLIMQGVFQRFPTLRVLLLGCGALWIPGHVERMDFWARMLPRDAPWLDRLPSGFFGDHFRVGTYSIELPPEGTKDAEARFRTAIETLPDPERLLVYAGCYPNADWAEQDEVVDLIPAEWHERVLRANALELFRFPDSTPASAHELDAAGARTRGG